MYSLKGRYELNLHKNGLPIKVAIDSVVPIQTYTNTPLGCYSKSNQLWVLLLEKAYAKIHGSYYALNSGESYEAFQDLTGCPSGIIPSELYSSEKFFNYLSDEMPNGLLVTAAVDGDEPAHGKNAMRKRGIITNHAYSIIDTDAERGENGELVKLVKLRNPWNRVEFEEKSSNNTSNWTPQIKEQAHLCNDEHQGEFWMDFKDFQEVFSVFRDKLHKNIKINKSYCHCNPDWKSFTQPFSFKMNWHSCEAPTFHLKIPKGNELRTISLHQEDIRVENTSPYTDISAFIIRKDGENLKCVGYLENVIEHTTIQNVCLREGEYFIVPYSSGALMAINRIPVKEGALKLFISKYEGKSKYETNAPLESDRILRRFDAPPSFNETIQNSKNAVNGFNHI